MTPKAGECGAGGRARTPGFAEVARNAQAE